MAAQAPPTGNEIDMLLGFIAQQRYAMKLTAYGLTDEQARLVPSTSSLSVGGLIKHTIAMEREWLKTAQGNATPFHESMGQYEVDFTFTAEDTLEALFAEQEKTAAETARIIREIGNLEHPVPVPKDAPWYPADLDEWSLRWVLLHLVEEIARHAGHADIVREHVDAARRPSRCWPPRKAGRPATSCSRGSRRKGPRREQLARAAVFRRLTRSSSTLRCAAGWSVRPRRGRGLPARVRTMRSPRASCVG